MEWDIPNCDKFTVFASIKNGTKPANLTALSATGQREHWRLLAPGQEIMTEGDNGDRSSTADGRGNRQRESLDGFVFGVLDICERSQQDQETLNFLESSNCRRAWFFENQSGAMNHAKTYMYFCQMFPSTKSGRPVFSAFTILGLFVVEEPHHATNLVVGETPVVACAPPTARPWSQVR